MSENYTRNKPESVESREKGRNVLVDIDLVRHPEKDYATGKLTEEGKRRFYEQLVKDFEDGISYDTIKFYVSPLGRGQEAKQPIERFLEISGIETTVRTNPSLAGRATEVGVDLKRLMTEILERKGIQTAATPDDSIIPSHEPSSQDSETRTNEILIRDFFDKNFPASPIAGKDIAAEIGSVIEHFSELASRLYSNSRVKLILISHGGILEHFIKDIYLKNHPEVQSGEVDAATIGGLLNYSEGPKIRIESDANGKQEIKMHFKDLDLTYPHEQ